ncbi:MAG TPA: hypothetical protein VGA78_12380 [Gemmatimonadales bacterium]
MSERRFSEEEVAAIFERATEAQQAPRGQLPPGEGLTLAELQEIGREVGIPPALVAQAAGSLEQSRRPASRTLMGLTIGVGQTVELGRRLSDQEWERLVVDLRETFDARGSLRHDGAFRQWTNGNLQVLLEPTANGHRLRLQTVKGDARGLMSGGLALVAIAAVVLLASVATGGAVDPSKVSILATLGAGMFGLGALRLPGWARLRRRQMEGVAERLNLMAASEPSHQEPGEGPRAPA